MNDEEIYEFLSKKTIPEIKILLKNDKFGYGGHTRKADLIRHYIESYRTLNPSSGKSYRDKINDILKEKSTLEWNQIVDILKSKNQYNSKEYTKWVNDFVFDWILENPKKIPVDIDLYDKNNYLRKLNPFSDSYGTSDLAWAVFYNHYDIARLLLEIGVTPNPRHGTIPLITAIQKNHQDIIDLLLKHKASPNFTNAKGESPLSMAMKNRDIPLIERLIKLGAPPNQILVDAVQNDDFEIVQLLLENRACPNFDSIFRMPILNIAVSNNNLEMIKLLRKYGAEINFKIIENTPLYVAIKHGNILIIKFLLEESSDPFEPSLLIQAVSDDNTGVVALLLEYGFDPNLGNPSLLSIAVQNKNFKIVEMLLEYGADDYDTAIEIASKNNSDEIVNLIDLYRAEKYYQEGLSHWETVTKS